MEFVILNHLIMFGMFTALTLSLNLINGFGGMFSLGHHGFWAAGALIGAVVVRALWPGMADGSPVPFEQVDMLTQVMILVASVVAGTISASLFGLIVGLPCLRLEGDYLAIVTLSFGEMVRVIGQNLEPTGISPPKAVFHPDDRLAYHVFYLVLFWLIALGTVFLIRNLINSAPGRAIKAFREDEIAAGLTGINVARYKLLVFLIGSGIAGAVGGLYAAYQPSVAPREFNFIAGVVILVMVVLGGRGSITGSVIAAAVLYAIPYILLQQEWLGNLKDWWQVIYALLLIVLMLSRPAGFMGKKEINETRVWRMLFGRAKAEPGVPVAADSRFFRPNDAAKSGKPKSDSKPGE